MASSQPIRTNWHPSKKHSDVERWICIYPAYINSKKTRQEGRRLPKDICVENPSCMEIRDVLSITKLPMGVENKAYSRERSKEMQFRGRVRVQMRNNDGTFFNPEFQSREDIMRFVVTKIPQLKTRQNKTSDAIHKPQQQQSQSGNAGGGGGGGVGGGGGKKNKGKRR